MAIMKFRPIESWAELSMLSTIIIECDWKINRNINGTAVNWKCANGIIVVVGVTVLWQRLNEMAFNNVIPNMPCKPINDIGFLCSV